MSKRLLAAGLCGAAMLAACSTPAPEVPKAAPQTVLSSAPAPAPLIPPLTLDAYKKEFARRVARASPDMFEEPLPEMFKSIVVLDIAIDHEGRLTRVAVRRSNGYKALENRAVESVQRASPFGAPAFTIRGRDGSVNFLETFLFREDGRFQIRSLVP
jgi:periplasmic protein TonB